MRLQVEAFQRGLGEVLPLDALLAFTARELKALVCGEPPAWTAALLSLHA